MAKPRQPDRPKPVAPSTTSVEGRPRYLGPRTEDRVCRIHKQELDATGFCAVAQAWWVPKFVCPDCAGPLWDNGYCANCTPKRHRFTGDYFEQRWDDLAGREWGHFVRVHGPADAPTEAEVAGYLAQLRAIAAGVGTEPTVDTIGPCRPVETARSMDPDPVPF